MRTGLMRHFNFILLAIAAGVLSLTPALASAQTSITPVYSFSNTQQSTTATTLQNSDVVITAANLLNGVEYLILYSASYGGNSTSLLPEVAVTYGSTTIAHLGLSISNPVSGSTTSRCSPSR